MNSEEDAQQFIHFEKQRLSKERERLKGETTYEHDYNHQKSNSNMLKQQDNLSKDTKDLFNYSGYEISEAKVTSNDDMEQWVSDTFYSYFPGFNNENQKRQLYLQKRQAENQENFVKHQMLNGQCSKKHVASADTSARSNSSSITSHDTINFHGDSKADAEIINVKNPYYNSLNHAVNSVRPGSTRYKLLQDLRHTNLSNVASENQDVMNSNRNHVEIESARKKEYQCELMQQIEEKRRSIKLLKEKEHEQEMVLTRRLQEQLKTIELEEKLEKERIKATRLRFNAEQNRSMRKHILEKLENDSKLLPLDPSISLQDDKINRNENKVYKYFSNSERNHRKKVFMASDIGLTADQLDYPKIERECFHLSEKICPTCDGPLKEKLEDFCLRCQSKISVPVKMSSTENAENACLKSKAIWNHNNETEESKSIMDESEGSYYLVCFKCERFYTLCSSCLKKSDVCRACKSKRNVCMNCRRTLCTFCLEEVACGKNVENVHINESEGLIKTNKETPYQVIVNDEKSDVDDNKSANLSVNNLNVYEENPPYSINIGRDSIFHPDKKITSLFTTNKINNFEIQKLHQKGQSLEKDVDLDNIKDDSENNIERLRRQTDTTLLRYLKNYSELVFQSRGTQTTPNTNARRDIVINGENSLSMPILCEMPKLTRKESKKSKKHLSNDLENLKYRWDIPAVQKFTVSPTSPKVVTQVGAIRKQLQTDSLFYDDED